MARSPMRSTRRATSARQELQAATACVSGAPSGQQPSTDRSECLNCNDPNEFDQTSTAGPVLRARRASRAMLAERRTQTTTTA